MKINTILVLFILIAAILGAGYFIKTMANNTPVGNTTDPVGAIKTPAVTFAPGVPGKNYAGSLGQINVSIGEYNDLLTVYIDDFDSGNVTRGNPLTLSLPEGVHSVKVCSESFCEGINQSVQASIKTTVDFETRLSENHPMGQLKISIGDYSSILPVYIDNMTYGNVLQGRPFITDIGPGTHQVKICPSEDCFTSAALVTPSNQTFVDFTERLIKGVRQADLTVTIGGYKAILPVYIDNRTVGEVSYEKAFTTRTNAGFHEIKVCSGVVCERERVELKFGKPTNIDFGARLIRDVEFPEPVVRITKSFADGNDMTMDVEFINPSTQPLTMTATISCSYTFLDYGSSVRKGASKIGHLTANVSAGERRTEYLYLYLSGGDSVSASVPVVLSVTIK